MTESSIRAKVGASRPKNRADDAISHFKWRSSVWSANIYRLLKYLSLAGRALHLRYGSLSHQSDLLNLGWSGSVERVRNDSAGYTIELPAEAEEGPLFHAFERRGLFELRNAVIDPLSGVVRLLGKGVAESTPWHPEKKFYKSSLIFPAFKTFAEKGVIFSAPLRWNYYHFLIEELPTILRATAQWPDYRLLIGPYSPRFVSELLGVLGVDSRTVWFPTRVRKLGLASRGNDTGWPHRDDVALIRQHLAKSDGHAPPATKKNLH